MGRHERTTRQDHRRLTWLQRHTLSPEGERIMECQEQLRTRIVGFERYL